MIHCGSGVHRGEGARPRRNAAARILVKALPVLLLLTAVAAATDAVPPLAAENGVEPQRNVYRFGVFPYVPAPKIDRIFGLAAIDLADALGAEVHLRTRSTFKSFAGELADESYDLIFVHPFFYVEAHDRHNYLPLARLDEPLVGVVMVAEDGPVRDASDLRGRTLALPPPLAAVSELAKAALVAVGLSPGGDVTLRHYDNKVSCLQAVAIEAADACAIPAFLLDQLTMSEEMRLRPLFQTPAINHLVFAVHKRVPETHRRALRARILGWSNTATGRAILATGAWPRFVEASDADYDDVRRYRGRLRPPGVGRQHARR